LGAMAKDLALAAARKRVRAESGLRRDECVPGERRLVDTLGGAL
jgi:hypothetical protein